MARAGALRGLSPGLAGDAFRVKTRNGIELRIRDQWVMLVYQML